MNEKLDSTQMMAFLEILRILRNEKNIIARKKIYEAHIDKKLDIKKIDNDTRIFIEKLHGDFDEIGFLVKEFDIGDKLFALYSDTIRRVWICMQTIIQHEKNERKKHDPSSSFGNHFEHLAFAAKQYRNKNNLPEPGFTDLRNL